MLTRALITGGAGFVGHHLARLVLEKGCHVLVVDDLSVGKRENIDSLTEHQRFGLSVTDVTCEEAVSAVVAEFQPEVVFHLAAIHFIPYCSAHPTKTIRINVLGTQHLLEAVRQAGSVRKFIFASTADVYQPQDDPNVEDETPTGSFDIYGVSKIFGEGLLRHYRRICPEVTFIAARLFNVYGPGETNPHVLPDILANLAESDTLLLGNVEPKRDFVYVTDVAEALWSLAASAAPGTEVNVATGREYSVRDLVECIAELTGRSLTIARDPEKFRESERMHLVGDIGKIHRLTGWTPKHTLADGLAELLEHEGLLGRRRQTSRAYAGEAV